MMRPPLALFVLAFSLVAAVVAGCRREEDAHVAATAESFVAYGELPGLRRTPHAGLQAELARLVDEGATPALLEQHRPNVSSRGGEQPRIADRENAAVALAGIFEPAALKQLNEKLAALWPADGSAFSENLLLDVQPLLAKHAAQQAKFRAAAERPASDFHFQHTRGLMADTSWVDVVQAGHRLEGFAAAQALHEERLADAVDSLAIMLRLCQFLSGEWHLVPRLQAANLRAEALTVLAAIVAHPRADAHVRQQLLTLLVEQLDAWPSDAQAWIGDRAEGLHTYEIVRDGHLLSVLSSQEIVRLRAAGKLRQTLESVREQIDADEAHYLSAMRRLIASCDQPFHARQPLFAELRTQWDELSRTAEFPFVAAVVLLVDFERGHRLQARDRALCEAWAIGLSLATNQAPPPYRDNPLTGAAYHGLRQQDRVTVWGVLPPGEDRQLSIPLPTEKTARRRGAAVEFPSQ